MFVDCNRVTSIFLCIFAWPIWIQYMKLKKIFLALIDLINHDFRFSKTTRTRSVKNNLIKKLKKKVKDLILIRLCKE